jgi:hypothetical protein
VILSHGVGMERAISIVVLENHAAASDGCDCNLLSCASVALLSDDRLLRQENMKVSVGSHC